MREGGGGGGEGCGVGRVRECEGGGVDPNLISGAIC